jgi:dTDP-4-amino-4,6-dideoxygalactose transaminase
MHNEINRRNFIRTAAAGSAALAWIGTNPTGQVFAAEAAKPALLGGTPVHQGAWPSWPIWNEAWEPAIVKVLRSGNWFRGTNGHVQEFEKAYAELIGAKRCLATASGTTALMVSLHVLGVDAGDEVIVSPFTFIASYNAILEQKALPVFADTDPETFTINPAKIEQSVTERTRAIMPVHIYGMACDMDPINETARKHNLAVVEDACQAWLAEYKGKKCGTLGDLGCFSFQNSKHLPSGEGGAVTGNSDDLLDRCQAYHNCGRAYGNFKGNKSYFTRGSNFRMQHFQAAMLLQQFEKLLAETARRRENAAYLASLLSKIPGIHPARIPGEGSRPVWHLFPFRYDSAQFNDLSREKFMRAMSAEGIPCSGGYTEQYNDGILDETIASRGYKRLFSEKRLKEYRDSFKKLKGNKLVCETIVAVTQNILLSEKKDMELIAEAIHKIQAHSAELKKQA